MFSTDRNIKTLEELGAEFKHYLELQKRFVKLEFVSKLIVLLSALILGMILFLIGAVAFILAAFCFASLIGDLTGSQTLGYACIAIFFILLAAIVFINRDRWITARLVKFLSNLFLDTNEK
jgi:ABC-type transporter Mla maintaining outer membrane lipid asymmetry permease subunit MlaE